MLDYLDAIRRDSDAFYAAADDADPSLGVPCCPGWTIADLVWHLSEVHWFFTTIIEQRITEHASMTEIKRLERPTAFGDLVALGRTNLDRLVGVLRATPDATAVWTWAPDQSVGFIRRHQVQEAAVHRWDMQNAARHGPPQPIEPAVAADSVDEFLNVQIPFAVTEDKPLRGTVHVHCTDTEGEWFIREDGRVEPIHAKGDVAVRASASDLMLALYHRVSLDDLELIGDADLARELVGSLDLS